jgi:hypothetical protein
MLDVTAIAINKIAMKEIPMIFHILFSASGSSVVEAGRAVWIVG